MNEELMEAALCAWEAVLEDDPCPKWDAGVYPKRRACIDLAPYINEGYKIANKDNQMDGHAYDWDFIPWFIHECVIWDPAGMVTLKPDWAKKCQCPDFILTTERLLREALYVCEQAPTIPMDNKFFLHSKALATSIRAHLKSKDL